MNKPTHGSDQIIYYPNIEFHDEAWLKSALCIWETIYRIVPSSYSPSDSDEVKRAIEADLIRNITLSNDDLSVCATEFSDFWDNVEVKPSGLDDFEESNYRLHPEKVDAKLLPLFESLSKKISTDGVLNLSEEVANGYMLFLSETVSRRRSMPKITDRPEVFAVMEYFRHEGQIGEYVYDREAKEYSAALTIPNIVPALIEYADMKDVIKLRNRTRSARQGFRVSVSDFIDRLSEIEETSQLETAMTDFRSGLRASFEDSRISLSKISQKLASTSISVGIPTSATTFFASLGGGDPFSAMKLAGIGAVGAIAAITSAISMSKSSIPSADASYYMELLNTFGPEEAPDFRLHKYDRYMEEFIND